MSAPKRNQALIDFQDDDSIKVLLVSLKAGNSGLNLVAASQVIIFDPFYNPFVEFQAIDRAHRIGQQRPVIVHRLVVANTVEDRVLALQEKKRTLIEGALDENAQRNVGRLNHKDLGFLFVSLLLMCGLGLRVLTRGVGNWRPVDGGIRALQTVHHQHTYLRIHHAHAFFLFFFYIRKNHFLFFFSFFLCFGVLMGSGVRYWFFSSSPLSRYLEAFLCNCFGLLWWCHGGGGCGVVFFRRKK